MAIRPLPWATLTIPAAKRLNGVASDADKRQISVAGANSVVPLTYGQDRIGALILNVGAPEPGDTTTLLIQVLWGFAGSALSDVKLNGQALPGGATVTTYLGTQTTADSTVVAAFAAYGITYTDTLEGYAYSVLSVPQSAISTEIQVTGLFSGRKLYDPRLDSTAGGSGSHRLATPSTWEYSDNPALALGDFLRSTVYGSSETVNWSTVATAATANDALIGSPSEKRRTVGVTFSSVAGVTDIAEALRAYAGCFLLPGPSGIKLVPDQDDSYVATYAHADGTIASIAPLTLRDLGNSPTVVEVIYTDTTETPWRDASAYAELAGVGSTKPYRLSQVRMPGVKRFSQAKREAIERLNKLTLQDVSTQIEVFDIGVRHEVADIIRVTHPIGLSLNKFRITEIQNPAAGRWLLSLIEHDAASYSDSVTTAPTYNGFPPDISGPVAPVEGLSSLVLTIYAQSPTEPACPTGGSYTFTGDVFVAPDGPFDPNVALQLSFNNTGTPTVLQDLSSYASTATITSGASVSGSAGKWGAGGYAGTQYAPAVGSFAEDSPRFRVTDSDPVTVEFWFYNQSLANITTSANYWEWRTPSERFAAIAAYANAGEIYYYPASGSVSLGTHSLNAWHFIQYTYDGTAGTGSLKIDIDGVEVYSANGGHSTSGSGTHSMWVGGWNNSDNSYSATYRVDDFRYTKGVARPRGSVPTEAFPLPNAGPTWSRSQPTTGAIPTWKTDVLVTTRTPDVPINIPTASPDVIGYFEQASMGATTVTVPTHIAGDMVLLFLRSSSTTPPAVPSGWEAVIDCGTVALQNAWRIVSFIDAAGTLATISTSLATHMWGAVVRGAEIGAVGVTAEALSGGSFSPWTAALPTLALQAPGSAIVLGGANLNQGDTLSAPSAMTELGSNGSPNLGGGMWAVWESNAAESSFTGRTTGAANGCYFSLWAIELKGKTAWTCPPVLHAQLSPNQTTVTLVRRTTTSTPPALPSADVTYTFATGVATGLTESWEQTLPNNSDPYSWETIATATADATLPTDVITPAEWSAPRITAQNGTNSATVSLVRKTNSSTPPSLPSANVTYTFATGVATGLTESWLQTLTADPGSYRWITTATATSLGLTDVIEPAEWSAARITSQDQDVYEITFDPVWISVAAYSNGFIPSYTGASATATLKRNGVVETGDWTMTVRADTHGHFTASVAGAVVSLTNLATNVNGVTIGILFNRTGYPQQSFFLNVTKSQSLGTAPAVNRLVYTSPSAGQTWTAATVRYGCKFTSNGQLFLGTKTGAGAWSWNSIAQDNWYMPNTTAIGSSYSLKITEEYNYSASNDLTGISLGVAASLASDVIFGWVVPSPGNQLNLGFRAYIIDGGGVTVDIGVMSLNYLIDPP
jgi:hypothetical protein